MIPVGTDPIGVAFSPNGAYIFITNYTSGTVSVISTATNTVIATITVGTNPFGIAISPNGNNIYITNQGSNSVSIINGVSFAVTTITTGVGTQPTGVAVSPDNAFSYVTNFGSGTVSIFNAATGVLVTTATVGTNPYGITISPDGTLAYVANQGSNSISIINTSTFGVTTVTTGVGSEPTALALNSAGTRLYVTNYNSGTVSVFNASSHALITTITVGTNPYGLSFTSGGGFLYVANYGSNTISVINTGTNIVTSTIPLPSGSNPASFGQFIQPASTPMTSIYTAPQGRLTLTSNTPVMTADATAQTSVYYTPYQGNIVPIYDGANMQSYAFGQLTMALNTSNHLSGHVYDLFIFLNSSVVTIAAGPAWSSTTARGTGAGTTQLQQIDGLWTNANSMTLTNGGTSYSSIGAGLATYVGSMYMTANGQTGMQFKPAPASGGSNNILALYNAYNRVTTTSRSVDSTGNWTYTTATWRAANGSTSNRINWLDGLQQSFVQSEYEVQAYSPSAVDAAFIAIGFDSTTTPQTAVSSVIVDLVSTIRSPSDILPQLGFHYIQALENAQGSASYFSGNNPSQGYTSHVKAALEM